MIINKIKLTPGQATDIGGTPGGCDAIALAQLAREGGQALFVARDDVHLVRLSVALAFFAPDIECLEFPAWDCLPYDRASPNTEILGKRIDTLTSLLEPAAGYRVVLSTVSALLQKVPPRATFQGSTLAVTVGDRLPTDTLIEFLIANGYGRAETVMEAGEFAIRGGIVDIFPSGGEQAVRLDFFGDDLDAIRTFDCMDQRTTGKIDRLSLRPVNEVSLDEAAQARFRTAYRAAFGAVGGEDMLYQAVTSGQRYIGMEHWLPLFHEKLETLFDYLPDAPVVLDYQWRQALDARLDLIAEYYTARLNVASGAARENVPYHPVKPDQMFLDAAQWAKHLASRAVGRLSPFAMPEQSSQPGIVRMDLGGRPGRDFAEARMKPDTNVFDAVSSHINDRHKAGKKVLVAAMSRGSLERLEHVMREHGITGLAAIRNWHELDGLGANVTALGVLDIERGFETDNLTVLSEQDILGQRLSHAAKRKIKPENFIAEASALRDGDLVVHVDHGIARYDGLEAIDVGGAPHDCLRLIYDGGDKLFLPVENIELISRYGSEMAGVQLDRLGGAAWQARKAKMKERIRGMADELIKVAAARKLRKAAKIVSTDGSYDEFCARFPFEETDDQRSAIEDVLGDLASGQSADRLICGDVGFGKTEVALRAAYVSVMSGKQVAIVVPTTLLCRQHHQNFLQRFADLPIRVEQISRLVTAKDVKAIKQGMKAGTVDIVIGTHAVLAKDVGFKDLGLLIVDEEQHFGVAHKEKLKKIKSDVHVLTLTATPIPRTLQLALTGVREMSIIATPPVDRLAVRTFILPFDPVVIREAVMRERFRGGQTFYVCPRIKDIDSVAARLKELVPEVKFIVAHGQMSPTDLEDAITAFYEGSYDILLSTNIIESGIDMPDVNTMIIHRADMFGLAQLYQLRGRVGRSKIRAYAYLTLPERKKLTAAAEKRLEVMQTLDNLGAGFSLASHDLDIRGAGNLLGDEQSGHIREVGIELYQQMLEEAVAEARGLDGGPGVDEEWSPQIGIGMAVLIPERYIADLNVRMELYRRLSGLTTAAEIESFAAELIDRFGSLPSEVENLLEIVRVKQLSRAAGVGKVDAGPKGAVITFHNDDFANPAGLVQFITAQTGTAKLRPDQKLVFMRGWDDAAARLAGVRGLLKELAVIAAAA